jgi:hypothetical protein
MFGFLFYTAMRVMGSEKSGFEACTARIPTGARDGITRTKFSLSAIAFRLPVYC